MGDLDNITDCKYDFDSITDRKGTGSLKHDCAAERGKPEGLIPLWVADMDFQVPPEVIAALKKTAVHGIFGYTEPYPEYFGVLCDWFKRRSGFVPEREWHIQTPGIVFALAECVKAFTKEGDAVIIQQPVYYPFSEVVVDNDRRLVNSALVVRGAQYTADFDDFEKQIVENEVKLFLLCSPHNPVGRVWTKDELIRMGEICLKHNVIIAADEIHANFVFSGHTHHNFLTLDKRFHAITVLCTSPGKTFNIAGLQLSDIFIPDPALKEKFLREHRRSGYSQLNTFAHSGALAAYKYGGNWLDALLKYLEANRDFIQRYIEQNIHGIDFFLPEGTYLAWLDFRKLNLTYKEQKELIINKAGLWLDSGLIFGHGGAGFERLNFACPRVLLEQALEQLKNAVDHIKK
ncbi:MAG: pyridoxal phosphate-dependent aminotransferase [Clostridiales bacterium]|jgi:cystathionine beta-lyase|nr:pyridoxal phosphate-dependent aminotransferase [Clostridiales bacterium]